MHAEGVAILHAGNEYAWRLALARNGNLLFFWLASRMVYLWGRRTLGASGGVAAVLIFTMVPTVLAHAGFATTDRGITACFAAAAYASLRLMEQPVAKTVGWLALAGGLMVLTKFSALLFHPAAVVAILAVWKFHNRPSLRNLPQSLSARLPWLAGATSPFFPGCGERKERVDLFPHSARVKLPIAALALIAVGLWRRPAAPSGRWPFWMVIAIATAILVVVIPARINIGLRPILPMFVFSPDCRGPGCCGSPGWKAVRLWRAGRWLA
jgi:hypothetical protein